MKSSPLNNMNNVFGLVIALITLIGGIAFLFTDFLIDRAHGPKRTVLALLFLAYSVFRIYRVYQNYTAYKNEQEK